MIVRCDQCRLKNLPIAQEILYTFDNDQKPKATVGNSMGYGNFTNSRIELGVPTVR